MIASLLTHLLVVVVPVSSTTALLLLGAIGTTAALARFFRN